MSSGPTPTRARLAGAAYWAMMRRIVMAAAAIDVLQIPLYAVLGSTTLSTVNVASVAVYGLAYLLIQRRRNTLAVVLIWLEAIVHAVLGSLLIGWDSGLHYFLLMFIPAIVVGSARRWAVPMVAALLAFYLGLHTLCQALGPLQPLQPWALQTAHAVNVLLIFGLFYAMASFYRATVMKAERRLVTAASTEPLTGLSNRSEFERRAAAELNRAQRRRQPTALLLGDVDHFKQINDEHGHAAGDQVLVELAQRLRTGLRDMDLLARWGGEEFLALLPESDSHAAAQVAERLRLAVATAPVDIGGRSITITMSFGVGEARDAQDLQAATARADQALYASKRAGRNRVSIAPQATEPNGLGGGP